MRLSLILLSLYLVLGFSTGAAPAQRDIKDENLDSLSISFQAMTRSLTTPEFERRKQTLRMFQRRGYVDVLSDVMADDGPSALLSLLKINAQIEYHLPHNELVVHIPPAPPSRPSSQNPWHFLAPASQPFEVSLVQDWTFPEDPWGPQ